MLGQSQPLPSAAVERGSIRVAQFDLDVLVICLNCSRADPKFFRDSARSVTGAAQCENMQLAVCKTSGICMRCWMLGQLMHGKERYRRANVEFPFKDGFDCVEQFPARPGLHPVT